MTAQTASDLDLVYIRPGGFGWGPVSELVALAANLLGARVVEVPDLYITPGFVDAHVHADLPMLADPVQHHALAQGITTYVIGQDGTAFAPGGPATLDYMRRYSAGFNAPPPRLALDWSGVGDYLARLDRASAINAAFLVPNGNVRMEVMGRAAFRRNGLRPENLAHAQVMLLFIFIL